MARGDRVRVLTALPTIVALLMTTAAGAQGTARPPLAPAIVATMAPSPGTPTEPPFATSLQIVPPGPHPDADGMTYRMTLAWRARPGAAAYRVFMWTDAVRAWYRTVQVTATRVDVHAFRSGCTAFIIVAVADPNDRGTALRGLETTNVVRFPLSARPELCPVKGG